MERNCSVFICQNKETKGILLLLLVYEKESGTFSTGSTVFKLQSTFSSMPFHIFRIKRQKTPWISLLVQLKTT